MLQPGVHFASLRIESIASSTIENPVASPDELLVYEATARADRHQVREADSYGRALDEGIRLQRERPISTPA